PQTKRRYQLPALVRSGRFDSYIVGSSTVHTLDPLQVSAGLGGSFANLALHGGEPHEQAQLVRLIGWQPSVRSILVGLDPKWCQTARLEQYNPRAEFPEWLHDDNRWNDILFSFNFGMLDLASLKLQQILWPSGITIRHDGFQNALPPDETFDVSKAQ